MSQVHFHGAALSVQTVFPWALTVTDPTCEASVAYQQIAKRIHEELGSKRRYKSELKLG